MPTEFGGWKRKYLHPIFNSIQSDQLGVTALSDELANWVAQNTKPLAEATRQRAPNMLPDSGQLSHFIGLISQCLQVDAATQIQLLQLWAADRIEQDAILAADWVSLCRALKETTWDQLPAAYFADGSWRALDRLFTHALNEITRLASNAEHGKMLTYMSDLRQQMIQLEKNKSNFISVAAHELRTPLTILEGYANMMRVELVSDEERISLMLDGFTNGIRRMGEIINDMIDVSMIDNHAFVVSFQPLYIDRIIKIAVRNLENAYLDRNITLKVDHIPYSKPFFGDPVRLVQALNKVLVNALKYTPDGGEVCIQAVLSRQNEQTEDINGYIDITIRDNGIGIAKGNLKSIFDKFVVTNDVSLHSSSKTNFKGGGPGLGLPIAKGIVEAHGGRIWAESPGFNENTFPGSAFHIELPLRQKEPAIS